MQHVLTPYSVNHPSFAWWEGTFSEQELDWLQERATAAKEDAHVQGRLSKEELSKIRRSQLSWLHKTSETAWVFEKLAHTVSLLNAQFYRFDLTGFGEALQLTSYNESEQGMYRWHQDFGGNGPSRKLSLVLQLSDPSNYDGGNLQILTDGKPQNVRKQRGLITVFPSYTLHQVTPVTSGVRHSLVAWITGPAYK
jgi:PKHD-type hydroxylase